MIGEPAQPSPDEPAAPSSPHRSIAVLPFEDHTAEGGQDHLCDGLAEEIRSGLSRLEGLRVAPRASAFALKGRGLSAREVGSRLGVDAVVTGGVDKSPGGAPVVGSELIDVGDGTTLWSQRFDAGATALFSIPEEIARRVADAFHIRLSDAQLRAIGRAGTRNVDAYEHYLRGRQLFFGCNRKRIDAAVEMFNHAIAADPSYALAYAGLADCCSYLFMYFDPRAANLKLAGNASTHALALDRNLPEAHAARGLAISLSQDYVEAEAEFEEAIRLDPSLFEALYFYARTCFAQGKHEQACRLYEAASKADHDDAQALTLLGFTYRTIGREQAADDASARARARLERLLELNPDDPRATYLLSDALVSAGEHEEGLRQAERAVSLDPDDPYTIYGLSCIYSRLEKVDQGIEALQRAVAGGFGHKAWIANDSDLDALREDPRFTLLLDGLASPED